MSSRKARNQHVLKIVLTGLTAALSYVVFTFLQIKIPLAGGDQTSLHLGNAVCVLGSLLLGGVWGGIGGAIGMTIGDLFDPIYIVSSPKTFLAKFLMGLVTGLVAHNWGHINEIKDPKKYFKWALGATTAGLVFNFIFDPILGYLYKLLILGKPAAELALAWSFLSTGINSVVSIIVSTALYMALRPALEKSGLMPEIHYKKRKYPVETGSSSGSAPGSSPTKK